MLEPHTPTLIFAPMEGLADAPMRAVQGETGAFTFAVSEFLYIIGRDERRELGRWIASWKEDDMPCLSTLTAMCLVAFSSPNGRAATEVMTGHRGHHSFVVRVVYGPFRRDRHHLRTTPNNDPDVTPTYWIDGKPEYPPSGSMRKNWYGTDGGFPDTEFYSISVKVDGKPWQFPKHLWQDCYEPNVPMDARLSQDGRRLTVDLSGSDAAGSYWVAYHLRKDGRATRVMHWADVEH